MKYTYDIWQFNWAKSENAFYADAWDLIALLPDGNMHAETFPSMKGEFYIKNYKTENERRFRFVKEVKKTEQDTHIDIIWQFRSEDNILCYIQIVTGLELDKIRL
jgi:hypothetical protein